MKFKLFIEYDGTRYSGWQKQHNAKTVQGTLINTVKTVFKDVKDSVYIDLQGAGRTDSGVHAIEQVAHLECKTMLAPHILKIKLNSELPSDVNILDIQKCPDNFHARHSAKARQYLYRISRRRTAFEKKYVWWIKDKLNAEAMAEAARMFSGMHDFSSFSDMADDKSPLTLVESIEVYSEDDLILTRIKASHFLWKMVRRIIGTLAEAGRGKITPQEIKKLLNDYSPEPAKFTAPPSGLFLEKIYY